MPFWLRARGESKRYSTAIVLNRRSFNRAAWRQDTWERIGYRMFFPVREITICRCTSSAGETEQHPDTAEAGKVSMRPEVIEQGQPRRAAEPDRSRLKVRKKTTPETPSQRQREIHEFTGLPPVSCCPAMRVREGSWRSSQATTRTR